MLKISVIIFLVNNSLFVIFAQSNLERSINSLSRAANESFSWQDIPGSALWISARLAPFKLTHKLDMDGFGIDREIQSQWSVPGSKSLGSTDPRRYPETVFFGGMAVTTAAGLILGTDSYEGYKHSFVFFKAVMYTDALTELIKNTTDRKRPDNSDNRSFFSGHTSIAFVTSSFLFEESNALLNDYVKDPALRISLKVLSFSALYGWAGYVGYSRIRDNKHYFTDVLTGAAVGTIIGIYFHNLYFEDGPTLMKAFSLGLQGNQPTLSFRYNLR